MATYFLSGTRLAGLERMMREIPRPASSYRDETEIDEAPQYTSERSQTAAAARTPQTETRNAHTARPPR